MPLALDAHTGLTCYRISTNGSFRRLTAPADAKRLEQEIPFQAPFFIIGPPPQDILQYILKLPRRPLPQSQSAATVFS